MKGPELTVVVATWNRAELTRRCLASLADSRLDLEVVVVDNGSRDATVAMIERDFPQVRLLRHRSNRGVTAAWQRGLAAATAPLVCIANNDLVFSRGCLARLVAPLREAAWVGATSPETPVPADEQLPVFMEPARACDDDPPAALRVGFAGWCFVFRRDDFPEGFDRRFFLWYQDKDFLYTLLFRRRGLPPFRWPVPGKVPVVVPGARVEHPYHGSHDQLAPAWIRRRTDRERTRFNRKWRGARGNRWAREVPWGRTVFLGVSPWERRLTRSGPAHGGEALVSVVIPCHGRPELLAATLRSVAAQRHRPLEVVVVDDASQEPLGPTVEAALAGFDGAFRVLRLERNSGPGTARAVGRASARGRYVCYLDADDLLEPEALERQVALLEARPELAMTYAPTAYLAAEDDPGPPRLLGRTDQDFDRILPHLSERIIWTTSSCLWRATVSTPRLWHPLFGPEDVLHDVLVGLTGAAIARTPAERPLVWKRIHPGAISSGIAEDVAYQLEILKAYDEMARAAGDDAAAGALIGRLYAEKVMTLLVHRRYWEARHAMLRARNAGTLPLDARLALLAHRWSGGFLTFALLRRWRWLGKRLRRPRLRSTSGGSPRSRVGTPGDGG